MAAFHARSASPYRVSTLVDSATESRRAAPEQLFRSAPFADISQAPGQSPSNLRRSPSSMLNYMFGHKGTLLQGCW